MQYIVAPPAPVKLGALREIAAKLGAFGEIQAFTVEIRVAFEESRRLQKCTLPINR
jgi:hypothetical protein